jgi:succinate dehydrogenase/fumarate reductase cytochrome b subunit
VRDVIFRILGGALGMFLVLAVIFLDLLFASNSVQEVESAHQYGGHVSFWAAFGVISLALTLNGRVASIAYLMLKFSIKGPTLKAHSTSSV